MTWHLSTAICSMPSVLDLTNEAPPNYSSEHFASQHDYMFPHSAGHHETLSGRCSAPSFPYLPAGSEVTGYCQEPHTTAVNNEHQSYRDNSFVWIGTNNFYPSSSYDQRYLEESYNPQRPNHRRQLVSERHEKTNSRKRRAPTVAQRRAANIRERRRMYNLNEAFDCLRQRIPTFAYEKRLSRIETLRLAISYISFMARIVGGEDPNTLRINTYETSVCPSSSLTQPILRHADAIPASLSCDNDDYDEDRDDNDDEEDEEDDTSEIDDDVTDDDHHGSSDQAGLIAAGCDTRNRS